MSARRQGRAKTEFFVEKKHIRAGIRTAGESLSEKSWPNLGLAKNDVGKSEQNIVNLFLVILSFSLNFKCF